MKSRGRFLLPVILALATPALAAPGITSRAPADMPAGEWQLDPTHASVTVKVSHLGFSLFTLRFDKIDARFTYDPADPSRTAVAAGVDPGSVNTGQRALDQALAGADWFGAAQGQTIRFVSRSIDVGDGRKGRMCGDLTMRGITRPVTFDVVFNGIGTGFGPPTPRAGFSATGTIRKSEYGMTRFADLLGDDIIVQIEAEFLKAATAVRSAKP